jgi:hypothetical protein
MAAYYKNQDNAKLGGLWHHEATNLHRAATLIHEMSHKVSETGDHVDVKNNRMVGSKQAHEIETKFVEGKTGLKGEAAFTQYEADHRAKVTKDAENLEKAKTAEKQRKKKIEQDEKQQANKKETKKEKQAREKMEKEKEKDEKQQRRFGPQKPVRPVGSGEPGSSKRAQKKGKAKASDPTDQNSQQQESKKAPEHIDLQGPENIQRVPDGPVARGAGCK